MCRAAGKEKIGQTMKRQSRQIGERSVTQRREDVKGKGRRLTDYEERGTAADVRTGSAQASGS
jgi:hypothetical protein